MDFDKLTSQSIFKKKNDILDRVTSNHEEKLALHNKLKHYTAVTNYDDLEEGTFIRYIGGNKRDKTHKLYNGGIVCTCSEDDTKITMKNALNKFFNIDFNNVYVFRKLTHDELYIISLIS